MKYEDTLALFEASHTAFYTIIATAKFVFEP